MTGAKAIVASLEQEGVTTVFGYPGAAICPVYDCLSDSPICHILVRRSKTRDTRLRPMAGSAGGPACVLPPPGPVR